jgi:acyl-CoA synthetase (AMP-forming)/AMP-acid ligase II
MSDSETTGQSIPDPERTLPGFLVERAERFAGRAALFADGALWSYADLAGEAARVADGLRELGVKPGDHVGVLLPNWPEFFSAVFGITALGAVAVCLNTMATENELAHYLDHARVRVLIYTPRFLKHDYEARLAAFGVASPPGERRAARSLEIRIALSRDGATPRGAVDFAGLGVRPADGIRRLRELTAAEPGAPAVIFFTSGSTALPKAVVHAHRALVHQAFVAADGFGLTEEDRAWGCLPMFFAGGFVIIALISFASGGAAVLQDHFEPRHALDLMERHRITFYSGWQLAQPLCDHPSFAGRSLALRKGIFANVPPAEKLLCPDNTTVGAYGLSETATLVCQARWDDPQELRHRGFGRPLPGVELRIVDPETRLPRAPGEVGEILVRGPSLMLGYLGVPREEAFDEEGFFRTGDFGRLDETGTLRFDGRLKEVIKTAGVNVAAAEVEACLERVPGVFAAYVVPVPHPVRGENVAAFLVARSGERVDVPGALEHCRKELASYKVPRHLFLLEPGQVPRTGTQKVDKPRLRKSAADLAGTPSDLATPRSG